jgi:hypothetical protein
MGVKVTRGDGGETFPIRSWIRPLVFIRETGVVPGENDPL